MADKKIVELHLDFTLPPPIYGYHVTTDSNRVGRTTKLVGDIKELPRGYSITSVEGNKINVSNASVKYWVEE